MAVWRLGHHIDHESLPGADTSSAAVPAEPTRATNDSTHPGSQFCSERIARCPNPSDGGESVDAALPVDGPAAKSGWRDYPVSPS